MGSMLMTRSIPDALAIEKVAVDLVAELAREWEVGDAAVGAKAFDASGKRSVDVRHCSGVLSVRSKRRPVVKRTDASQILCT